MARPFKVSEYLEELYKPDDCLILIKLDIERIRLLKLEVTAETIAFSLLTSKLKIRPKDCQVSMLYTFTYTFWPAYFRTNSYPT
jgi:hypothetical protein